MVSKKVRDSLPLILCSKWKANDSGDQNSLRDTSSNSEGTAALSMDDECFESLDYEENEKHPEMYLPLKNSLLKSFKLMDKELKLHPTLDCFCSGSTAVTLVKQVCIIQHYMLISCETTSFTCQYTKTHTHIVTEITD